MRTAARTRPRPRQGGRRPACSIAVPSASPLAGTLAAIRRIGGGAALRVAEDRPDRAVGQRLRRRVIAAMERGDLLSGAPGTLDMRSRLACAPEDGHRGGGVAGRDLQTGLSGGARSAADESAGEDGYR